MPAAHTPDPAAEPERTTDEPSRRRVLRTVAATAAGALGAAAIGRRAEAANGGNVVLGQLNEASLPTRIRDTAGVPDLNGPGPIVLQLESHGGHLRFVGGIGDFNFGTYPDGTLVYNASNGLDIWLVDGFSGVHPTTIAKPGCAGAFTILPVPQRVYDSRPGATPDLPNDGRISTGQVRTVNLIEGDVEGIPENIDGVMMNVTVTETIGFGFLTVYSAGVPTTPNASSINWFANGMTVANQVVSAVEFARINVACGGGGSTHFIVDVVGTYG
jgi:hypothetical protein